MKEKEDAKMMFKEALYDTVEYLIKYELSPTAKSLLNHYFNSSHDESTLTRAIESIEKYTQEPIPAKEERSPRLERLLNQLARRAARWDSEDR